MAFSQILSCSKTFTFINPSSPGSTFSVTPARAQTVKGRIEASVQSRRYRRGWTLGGSNCIDCGTKEFEYSSDWKYILPKSPTPSPVQPIQPWTITPSLSVGQPTPGSLILDGQI